MSKTDLTVRVNDNLYKGSLLQSKKKVSGEVFKEPFLDSLVTDVEQSSFSLNMLYLERTGKFVFDKSQAKRRNSTKTAINVAYNNFGGVNNLTASHKPLFKQKESLPPRSLSTSFSSSSRNVSLKTSNYLFALKVCVQNRRFCKNEALCNASIESFCKIGKDISSASDMSFIFTLNTESKRKTHLLKAPQQELEKQSIKKRDKEKLCARVGQLFLEMALKRSRQPNFPTSLQEKQTIPCLLQIGDYVNSGDKIGYFFETPIIITESGKVLKISKTQVTIQKMQPVLFYSQAEIHVESNEWVERGTPILTLAHQTLVTGDIVQGIPRIEQLFEASTSAPPGALLQDLDSHSLDDFSIYNRNGVSAKKEKRESSVDTFFKSQHTSHLWPVTSSLSERHNKDVSKVSRGTNNLVEGKTILNNMFLESENLSVTDSSKNRDKKHNSAVRSTTEEKPVFLYQTLQSQVRESFRKKWDQLPLPVAVRQSLEEIQQIIVESIQKVYISQGVLIADKHIEIIVRQMTSKAQVFDGGSTGLLIDEIVSLQQIENANISTPGQKALYLPVIMGLTQAALSSDSFVSAASFQETTRVLSRDAVAGKTDFLRGLKEKVIIGDLIDAGTGLDVFYIYSLFSKTIFENKFRDILNRKVTHKTLKKLVLTVAKSSPNDREKQ